MFGVIAPTQILRSKILMQFKVNVRPNVLVVKAVIKLKLHSTTLPNGMSFTVNLFKDNIETNTDCDSYGGDLLDFGASLDAHLEPNNQDYTELDIAHLVQRAVSRKDWGSKGFLTLVISSNTEGAQTSGTMYYQPDDCIFDLQFRDFSPSK